MTTATDTPPAQLRGGVSVCGVHGGDRRARFVRLAGDIVEVVLPDGMVVEVASATLGDDLGRGPVDVVLRPDARTVTVTWRDGRRGRYDVAWLTAATLSLAA